MIADKLEAAAEVVRAGWCQGVAGRTATGDPRGSWRAPDVYSRCIRGAIHYVFDGDAVNVMAAEQHVLWQVRKTGWVGGLADWNDLPGRKQHEVVQVLLLAADAAGAPAPVKVRSADHFEVRENGTVRCVNALVQQANA